MKKIFLFIILATSIIIFACQPPGGLLGDETADGTTVSDTTGGTADETIGEAAQRTLQSLPELKITLPGSLSVDSTASGSRAVGDISVISSADTNAIKSQAWFDLQGNGGNQFIPVINSIFELMKEYAVGNTIPVGIAFNIPVENSDVWDVIGMEDNGSMSFDTNVNFKVSGESADNFSIFTDMSITVTQTYDSQTQESDLTISGRIDITEITDTDYDEIKIFVLASQTMGGQSMTIPMYIYYNTATGSSDVVMEQTYNSQKSATVMSSKVGSDGSISNIRSSFIDGVANSVHVAYGDDYAGGIASMSSWSWDDDGDGIEDTHNCFWGEYYDANGNLIRRDNGDDNLWVPADDENLNNLKDFGFTSAPVNIEERHYSPSNQSGPIWYNYKELKNDAGSWITISRSYGEWVENSSTWYYEESSDNGETWNQVFKETWNELTGEWAIYTSADNGVSWSPAEFWYNGNYAFKASEADWSGDDVIYYYDSWSNTETDIDGDGQNDWVSTTTYYQGYVVPTPISKFGKSYYMSYEYPLNQLLPLTTSYADIYDLIQEEGETQSWDWTDWEGNLQTDTWTWYSYYLNKKEVDRDDDGNIDVEDPVRYEADYDINLDDKLSEYDVYYWNNGVSSKVKGYFFRTTGSIPPYFSTPDSAAINSVEASLKNLIDDAYASGIDDYIDALTIAKADPAAGEF